MNIKKTIQKGIAIGATALALLSPLSKVEAQAPIAARSKIEYTGDLDHNNTYTETIAIAPAGKYDGRHAFGQFADIFRGTLTQNGTSDSYAFGLRTEPQKFFKVDNALVPTKSLFWGSVVDGVRDNKAIANESHFKANNTSLSLRQEYQFGDDNLYHLGGTLGQKIGKFTPEVGFDRISDSAGNRDQFFASLIYEPTLNDFTAISFANQKFANGRENNKTRLTLGHYGPKESWGHRSFLEYASDNKGEESFTLHSVIAPFGPSTFSRLSNRLIAGNTIADDDSFKFLATPFTLYTENFLAHDRIIGAEFGSPKGLGLRLDASVKRNALGENGSFGAQALYVFRSKGSIMGQNEYGLSLGATHKYSPTDRQTILNAGVTFRPGKNFTAMAIVDAPCGVESLNDKPVKSPIGFFLMAEAKF